MFDLFKRSPGDERPWSERLKSGLGLSRERLTRPLAAILGRKALSEDSLEELETALLGADVGVAATERLLDDLRDRWKRADPAADPRALLKASLAELLAPLEQPLAVGAQRPFVIMLDAVAAARARGIDVVLADTAGRLPTQRHLMEELKKIRRVIAKAQDGAPHETLLVLDANTGQNALTQVAAFDDALGLTGIVLTKLDGTAKGGIVAAMASGHAIPLKFIGVGEGVDDLRPFHAQEFAEALVG